MVPATGAAPGPLIANVAVVIVEAFIASLNEAVMTATPTPPLRGLVALTVGAVVSPGGPVTFSGAEHPTIAISMTTSDHAAKRPV